MHASEKYKTIFRLCAHGFGQERILFPAVEGREHRKSMILPRITLWIRS